MSGTDLYNDTTFDPGSWSDTVIYTPAGGGTAASVQVGGLGATTVTLNGSVGQDGATVTLTIETGGSSIQRQLQAVCDIVGGGVFTDGLGDYYVFSNGGLTQGDTYDAVAGYGHFGDGPPEPACFAAGTRIETRDGARPVEALRPGDQVRAVLRGARGAGWAPVIWTGHREVLCARHPHPENVWPVRIAAGAFGPGRPVRDLHLSPDHSVFDNAALIPVRHLINDATIAQVPMEQVTYWHVELPSHDVLLAEGLETESYLDTGNRAGFKGTQGAPAAPFGPADHAMSVWRERGCARLLLRPAEHAPLRQHLHQRALALGYRETDDAGLVLRTNTGSVACAWDGANATAVIPPGTRALLLCSRSAVPSLQGGSPDGRRLGVAVTRLGIDGRSVRLDDPRLNQGWHQPEGDWRWTTGEAVVPLTPLPRPRHIEISTAPMLVYWRPPEAAEAVRTAA